MSFLPTKRLLKDLPFLDAGSVLVQCNGTYRIHRGEQLYGGQLFSSSSNGVCDLDKKEKEIVDEIYENPKWFEDATFSKPNWDVGKKRIVLSFDKAVDEDELMVVAKCIYRTLEANWVRTVEAMGHKEYVGIFSGKP